MNFIVINESMAAYMELDEDQLIKIQSDKNYYMDSEFVRECSNSEGDHAVVVLLVCKYPDYGYSDIMEGLRRLSYEYKSVSFWNRGHKRLYTRRGKCSERHIRN